MSRLYQLRAAIEEFDALHQDDGTDICGLGEEEWRLIKAYMDLVAPFKIATKKLGGDTYPASMMVVPMLAELLNDLVRLPETRRREEVARQRRGGEREGHLGGGRGGQEAGGQDGGEVQHPLPSSVQAPRSLQRDALCLLDPRNLDLFFEAHDDLEATKNVIKQDCVYQELRDASIDDQNNQAEPVVRDESTGDLRAQLLAAKRARTGAQVLVEPQANTVDHKIDREIEQLLKNEPINKYLELVEKPREGVPAARLVCKGQRRHAAHQSFVRAPLQQGQTAVRLHPQVTDGGARRGLRLPPRLPQQAAGARGVQAV